MLGSAPPPLRVNAGTAPAYSRAAIQNTALSWQQGDCCCLGDSAPLLPRHQHQPALTTRSPHFSTRAHFHHTAPSASPAAPHCAPTATASRMPSPSHSTYLGALLLPGEGPHRRSASSRHPGAGLSGPPSTALPSPCSHAQRKPQPLSHRGHLSKNGNV